MVAADGDPSCVYTRWIYDFFRRTSSRGAGYADGFRRLRRSAHDVVVEVDGSEILVSLPTKVLPRHPVRCRPPRHRGVAAGGAPGPPTATGAAVAAPMQATIVKVAVAEGDKVVKGDLVLVLEAMKMEQPIVAHKDGTIGLVNAEAGATVSSGHLLLAIKDA